MDFTLTKRSWFQSLKVVFRQYRRPVPQSPSIDLALSEALASHTELNKCIQQLATFKIAAHTTHQVNTVLAAHFVRLYKLNTLFHEQAALCRMEFCSLLSRLIYETVVNLRFLLRQDDSMFQSYIAASFKNEHKLQKALLKKRKRRGVLTVNEQRLLATIQHQYQLSGLEKDADIFELAAKWDYKAGKRKRSIYDRLEAIGARHSYKDIFAAPAHAIHGDWLDALQFHVRVDAQHAMASHLSWSQPDPALIKALSLFIIQGCLEYMEREEKHEYALLKSKLRAIQKRFNGM